MRNIFPTLTCKIEYVFPVEFNTVNVYLYLSDVGDSPTDQVTEDPDSEVYPSEDGKCIVVLFIAKFPFWIVYSNTECDCEYCSHSTEKFYSIPNSEESLIDL